MEVEPIEAAVLGEAGAVGVFERDDIPGAGEVLGDGLPGGLSEVFCVADVVGVREEAGPFKGDGVRSAGHGEGGESICGAWLGGKALKGRCLDDGGGVEK